MVSLLLHMGTVLLLFSFLNRSTKNFWPSAFAAAFFALHPLRVESVAWAAERKDVLSLFLGMASVYAYTCYAEKSRLSSYFLCLTFFALSLMAKPMMVTLPFVFLLLDYWPLGRWPKALTTAEVPTLVNKNTRKKKTGNRTADSIHDKKIMGPLIIRSLLREKVPFIFLTVVSSILTLWGQHKFGTIISAEHMPFFVRIQNVLVSYVSYLEKTFWPVGLAVFYPYEFSFPLWQVLLSCIILTAITLGAIYYIKKMPFLFVGWFWYLGTLVPIIGIIQVALQARADRFTYLPSIGIAMMLAWGIPFFFQSEHARKKILFPAGITVLSVLAILTWQQCGYWKNSRMLFKHCLQFTKNNAQANFNMGKALFAEGNIQEAVVHYDEAIRILPGFFQCYYERGNAYNKLGQYQRAIEDYSEVLRWKPDVMAYLNRAMLRYNLGDHQRAIEDYNEVIRIIPDDAEAYFHRGKAYSVTGQYQRAFEDYSEAVRLQPDYAEAWNNRGAVYFIQGNRELGCRDARKACELGKCKILEMAKAKGDCP